MMNIQLFAPAVMKFATDKRNNFKLELSWGIDKQILPQLFYLYYNPLYWKLLAFTRNSDIILALEN